jgi:hypothetical protein
LFPNSRKSHSALNGQLLHHAPKHPLAYSSGKSVSAVNRETYAGDEPLLALHFFGIDVAPHGTLHNIFLVFMMPSAANSHKCSERRRPQHMLIFSQIAASGNNPSRSRTA